MAVTKFKCEYDQILICFLIVRYVLGEGRGLLQTQFYVRLISMIPVVVVQLVEGQLMFSLCAAVQLMENLGTCISLAFFIQQVLVNISRVSALFSDCTLDRFAVLFTQELVKVQQQGL